MKNRDLKERVRRLKNLPTQINDLLEMFPVDIPEKYRKMLIDKIFEDQDLKNILDALEHNRPPRFVLIGRTGVGKSSLLNAMFGTYLAEISDVEVGTVNTRSFEYWEDKEKVLEVLDTRGIGESEAGSIRAEDQLKKDIENLNPDAILFLVRAKDRSRIDKDIAELKEITAKLNDSYPVIAVSTQVDELEPSRIKEPNSYPSKKIKNIQQAEKQLQRLLEEHNVNYLDIVSVSSYVEWGFPNVNDPIYDLDSLDKYEKEKLEIKNDFRFQIDELIDKLANNVELNARINFFLETKTDNLVEELADKIIKAFASAAGAVGLNPIPVSDLLILTPLQAVLVSIIAYLSGRDFDYETAKEFIAAIGGNMVAAKVFQQGAKLLNGLLPGVGSGISATIAYSGTILIGTGAKKYFLYNVPKSKVKDYIEKNKNKVKKEKETIELN
jgi:predicted GTPase